MYSRNGLISNFQEEHLHNVAYDLRIQNLHWVGEAPQDEKRHILKPGDSVFVSTIEDIDLPSDLVGFIIPRNSSIHMGLDIVGSVYQPGHHTRIFVRVTNIADKDIILQEDMSIFSIMFYQLNQDVTHTYNGVYKKQFDFYNVTGIHSIKTAITGATNNAKKEVESITKNIYTTVLTLMSIFIAMFSVITLNAKGLRVPQNGFGVLFYNCVLIGAMSAVVLMASFLLDYVSYKIRVGSIFWWCLRIGCLHISAS